MQNITKRFRVTDGGNCLPFRTLKEARQYLANSTIFTNGQWKSLRADGFYIEKFSDENGWQRATYIVPAHQRCRLEDM